MGSKSAGRTYGMGIVGAGMIGNFHAAAIRSLPNARLVGVFDQAQSCAQEFARKHGIKAYASLEEFLSDPAIQAVTIGTPSGCHMEPTVAAAAHGKHAICEKPLDVTLERVDRMIAAHRAAGTTLGGIFNPRYEDLSRVLKRMVDAGRLGRIVYAAGHVPWFRTQAYYGQGGWRGTWKFDGGGALMNQGIHTVDLLQWMVGAKVRRVAAMTALLGHTGLEVEDVAAAVLQFEGGAIGMLFASTALWPGLPARIELGGTGGTIVADAAGLKVLQFAKPEPADERVLQEFGRIAADTGVADPKAISPECHRRVFADFLAALDAGGEPELSAAEARKAVEIVLAVYRSAKTGQAVDLPLAE